MPIHYFHEEKGSVGFTAWNLRVVPWKYNLLLVVCLVPAPVVAAVNWQFSSVEGSHFQSCSVGIRCLKLPAVSSSVNKHTSCF